MPKIIVSLFNFLEFNLLIFNFSYKKKPKKHNFF